MLTRMIGFVACLAVVSVRAQVADTITLGDAISLALDRSLDIKVARNEARIADNNVHIGNAGLLPQVAIDAGYTTALEDLEIQFAGDQIPPVDQSNVRSSTYRAAIGLNYLLFDGMGTFHTFTQLQLQGEAGRLNSRVDVENTILEVVQLYLEAARLREIQRTDQLALALSHDRRERLRTAYEFGTATRLELLNAEVDHHTDSINVAISAINLSNATRVLNVALNNPPDHPLVVETEVTIARDLSFEDLQERALANNAFLRLAEQNVRLSEVDRQLVRAQIFPRIGISGAYGFTRSENDAGLLLFQQNVGFNGAVDLTWNLFNGRQRAIQERNATIALDNAILTKEATRLRTDAQIANAYDTYRNFLQLLELERRNLELTRLNMEHTQDALRMGQVTGTQFREAQLNLTQAEIRMADIRYQGKQAEVELYRLAGMLVE